MILLLKLMPDVVWLTGWRPGGGRPGKAAMQNVLVHLSTCQWTGPGWAISASTDQSYVADVLRDHLYHSVGGVHTADRFVVGGAVPVIPAGGDLSKFLPGCPMPAPSGVEMEMAKHAAGAGAPVANIDDFLTRAPLLSTPVVSGHWGPPGAVGPQVLPDSALLIHIPINTHGTMRIQFVQVDAGGDTHRKEENWKTSSFRYRLLQSYRAGAAGRRDGVRPLALRDAPDGHYESALGGQVNVIVSAKNSSPDTGENADFWFEI